MKSVKMPYIVMNTPITNEQLSEIAELAERQLRLEQIIAETEKSLEALLENHRNLSQNLIPEAMMSVGMEEFILKDGTAVRVEKFYAAKIPDDRGVEAFAWLRKHGHESLIKRELKCVFGKGEDKDADKAVKLLIKQGFKPTDKSGVHPQTLKAFVRERMEAGDPDFDQEMFGCYVGNRTKLTSPK